MVDDRLRIRNGEELAQDRDVVSRGGCARRREPARVTALAVTDAVVEASKAASRQKDAQVSAVEIVDANSPLISGFNGGKPALDVVVRRVGLAPVARPAE